MLNTTKLSQELVDAGITTHGNCNSAGIVWDDDNNEIQDRPDVAAVIAAHDHDAPTEDELRQAKVAQLISDNFAGFDLDNLTPEQAFKALKILFIYLNLADKDGIVK